MRKQTYTATNTRSLFREPQIYTVWQNIIIRKCVISHLPKVWSEYIYIFRHDDEVERLYASLDASSNSQFQLDEEHLQNSLSVFNQFAFIWTRGKMCVADVGRVVLLSEKFVHGFLVSIKRSYSVMPFHSHRLLKNISWNVCNCMWQIN
jgi:hypothetical protein